MNLLFTTKKVGSPALFGAALLVAMIATGAIASPRQSSPTPPAAHRASGRVAPATLPAPPVKTYGSSAAPIKMEAFTDYECPGCRALYEGALRQMIDDYVASGKVYLVHHDFPLQMHKYSGDAARWANASATVGEFASAEAALFDNQDRWASDGNIAPIIAGAMSKESFTKVQNIMKVCTTPAPQAGPVGTDPMAKSGHSCPLDPYIAQDIKLGETVPVDYTPTYVIYYKGQKMATSHDIISWPILKQFLDTLLHQ